MQINVHVKEKTVVVKCGEGGQKVIWLAHVGLSRYDSKFGLELGVPKGVQLDSGDMLDSQKKIKDVLKNDQHVFVVLKEDSPQRKIPSDVDF